jgi:hypothetical protein
MISGHVNIVIPSLSSMTVLLITQQPSFASSSTTGTPLTAQRMAIQQIGTLAVGSSY